MSTPREKSQFVKDLEKLLDSGNVRIYSSTPSWVLAEFISEVLSSLDRAVVSGRNPIEAEPNPLTENVIKNLVQSAIIDAGGTESDYLFDKWLEKLKEM